MKFQPKTDWKYNDTPTEGDFNRIEQGIADAHEGNDPIIQQDTPPDGVTEGRLWLDTSDDTYQGTVFEELKGEIDGHLADKANPHGTTKTHVGLGNVDNVKQIPVNEKGQPNGVAVLDENGNVLNGKGGISSGGLSGIFTDTTTVIQPLATYTKRIPISGKPTQGRLSIMQTQNQGMSYQGLAFFTDDQGGAIGSNYTFGSNSAHGHAGSSGMTSVGVLGTGSSFLLGGNIILMNVWIDNTTDELVLEFMNHNQTVASTFSIAKVSGALAKSGLIWEVS